MKEEIWKDIKGYEGSYQVSNLGRVKGLRREVFKRGICTLPESIMKQRLSFGYCRICLTQNGMRGYYFVHRLVADAFIPNPENKPEIDHINTVKNDNRIENLQWATKSENAQNPISVKRKYASRPIGNKNPNSKIIKQYSIEGQLIKVYHGLREMARETGYSRFFVNQCCKGKYQKAYGYIWKYAE